MPIHDVGYRNWSGPLTSSLTRWWTISEAGIRTALKSRWIRRAMLASWLPVIYFGVLFFMFEKIMDPSISDFARQLGVPQAEAEQAIEVLEEEGGEQFVGQLEDEMRQQAFEEMPLPEIVPNREALAAALESGDIRVVRNTTWNWLLSTFLRYPQGLMTLLIIGLIVPPLISRDVRSRAFLLYYSRPITRLEYLFGKLAIPGMVLVLITLVPAMALYCFGVMLSPDMSVVLDTWDIPFRIVIATAVGVIPTCLIALLFSSLTQESRYAGFAWFTVWGLGAVVWWVIYASNTPFDGDFITTTDEYPAGAYTVRVDSVDNLDVGDRITIVGHPSQIRISEIEGRNLTFDTALRSDVVEGTRVFKVLYDSNWSLISIYATIGRVQAWVFGLESDLTRVWPSMVVLTIISVLALVWLNRRISAPVRN